MENYLMVAGIGHRDIADYEKCYKATCVILQKLKERHLDKELHIVSPLAEGADRLIVKAGLSLGITYSVLLPMPIDLLEDDCIDKASLDEFRHLLANAKDVKVTGYYANNTRELVKRIGVYRDYQYRACGYKLARDSQYIVALFNGDVSSVKLGGTADIVTYRNTLRKPLILIRCARLFCEATYE